MYSLMRFEMPARTRDAVTTLQYSDLQSDCLTRLKAIVVSCLACVLLAFCWVSQASAAATNCNASVSGSINFDSVNLVDAPYTDINPTVLSFGCDASPGDQVLVCIGLGATTQPSSSINPRYMVMGSGSQQNKLAFNVFTDASRTQIWGDFGNASFPAKPFTLQFANVGGGKNGKGDYYASQVVPFYGRIVSLGQTALPAGQYAASPEVSIHVRFATYTTTAPGCNDPSLVTGGNQSVVAQANVSQNCGISSVSTLDFGTVYQTLTQNVDSQATITALCNGSPSGNKSYTITLGYGNQPSGTTQRRMAGPNGALLNYNLYQDLAHTKAWGNTAATGVQKTGTGQPEPITVYGRVPPQPVQSAGVYNDTVVVTMNY